MRFAEARDNVGGLSDPSKMPGPAYSISAHICITGARLRSKPGSVCASCYALKGRYQFDNVQGALQRRAAKLWEALADPAARARFIESFEILLAGVPDFRWHDSGDLQSPEHLGLIADICRATPATVHWLPTKEPRFVKRYAKAGGLVPGNLVIRISSPMIDGPRVRGAEHASRVYSKKKGPPAGAYACPAHKQDNRCGACRACWNKEISTVAYLAH